MDLSVLPTRLQLPSSSFPPEALNRHQVLSLDTVSRRSPFGLNSIWVTVRVWPCSLWQMDQSEVGSHKMTSAWSAFEALEAEAMTLPLVAREYSSLPWP